MSVARLAAIDLFVAQTPEPRRLFDRQALAFVSTQAAIKLSCQFY